MNLRIHRLAVAEIDHEVNYYESCQAGLGIELEDDIDAAFSLILRFPQAAPQWRERPDRRVAVLDRFPFTIPLSDHARGHRGPRACAHKPSSGLLVETHHRDPMTRSACGARQFDPGDTERNWPVPFRWSWPSRLRPYQQRQARGLTGECRESA